MEQIHSRALEALQPFVHLAASTASSSPRLIANLIENATSSPSTYVFAELLETPAVQALASPDTPEEYRGYLTLLQIFAWGTWEEYHSTPSLPALNEAQSEKLRLLSLLTLSTVYNPLTYPIVMSSLGLKNHAELESLVTKAIYSSLIAARLAPASNPPVIRVSSVAPLRDVPSQSVQTMISALSDWQGRCKDVISGIEAEITKIRTEARKARAAENERQRLFERSVDGWDGDAQGDGGAGDGAASGSKRSLRLMKEGSSGFAGAGRRLGGAIFGGNKRDHNEGPTDPYSMDIDEGFGEGNGPGARQSKRHLAMGQR